MVGFLSGLFGGGYEQEAAAKNTAATNAYGDQSQNFLTQGYNTGVGNLGSAIGAYTPLANLGTQYNAAGGMLTNALGINGPGGNNIAAGAFQNNPGYTGAINAGLDIINRRRGIMGMENSGNADIDAQTFGQNLQNQQYNTWLQNLQQTAGMGLNATSAAAAGQGTGFTNLANLAQTYAGNQAGVAGNVLSGTVNANDMAAAGQAAGAKNLLGAGLSLATLGMSGGTAGFGGSLFGKMFSGGTAA